MPQPKAAPDHAAHSWRQLGAYAISGGAFFWTGYIWFFIADQGLHWSLMAAKLSASALGLLVNFLLQHYWVFATHKSTAKTHAVTSRYIVISAVNFFLDYIIVASLKSYGLTPYIGQFISSGFFSVWNYYWYKFWVFAHPKT